MSLRSLIIISLAASACAGGFLEQKEAKEKEMITRENIMKMQEQEMEKSHAQINANAQASAMKTELLASLAHWNTKEGQQEMEKLIKEKSHSSLSEGAEELEWFSNVARDGVMKFDGKVINPFMPELNKLPKGLPEFPEDPKEREIFINNLPVDAGEYSVMLKLKNHPNSFVEVAKDKFKGALSSLAEDSQGSSKDMEWFNVKNKELVEVAKKLEETKKSSVELIKASPKEFKKALRDWEKIVPKAASLLLQTNAENKKKSEQEAKTLAARASSVHVGLFGAVEGVANKDQLMSIAQNRITSLLMRQSEESLKDFDALEGCTDAAKDYSGSETRCLCVADNICHKVGHASSGSLCSIISSSTCMMPNDEEEAKSMSTV